MRIARWGLFVCWALSVAVTGPIWASVGTKINHPAAVAVPPSEPAATPGAVGCQGDSDDLGWTTVSTEHVTSTYQPSPITEDLLSPWVAQVNICVALVDPKRPATSSVEEFVTKYPAKWSTEDAIIHLIDAEVVSPSGNLLGVRATSNTEFSREIFEPMSQRIQRMELPVSGDMGGRLRQGLVDLVMLSQRVDHHVVSGHSEKTTFLWIFPIWVQTRDEWSKKNDVIPQWSPDFDPMSPYRREPEVLHIEDLWAHPRSDDVTCVVSRQTAYRHVGVEFCQVEKPRAFWGWGDFGVLDLGVGADRVWDSTSAVSLIHLNVGGNIKGEWGEIHADIGPCVQWHAESAFGTTVGFRLTSPSTGIEWIPVGIAAYRQYQGIEWSSGRVMWEFSEAQVLARWKINGWHFSIGKEFLSGQQATVGDGVFVSIGGYW